MSFAKTFFLIRNRRFDMPYYITNSENSENSECSICLEKLDSNCVSLYSCEHIYHESCIREWLKKNRICPLCRCSVDDMNECGMCICC